MATPKLADEKVVAAAPSDARTSVRKIELDPEDWGWATWRRRLRKTRSEPAPFDQTECAARLARVTTRNYGYEWNWQDAHIASSLSPQEAAFWLAATRAAKPGVQAKALADNLTTHNFEQRPSESDIRELIAGNGQMLQEWLLAPLANLLSFREVTSLLQDEDLLGAWCASHYFLAGFLKHVLPFASDEEVEEARRQLRPKLKPDKWLPGGRVNTFHLAARLGMQEEIATLVSSWSDDRFTKSNTDEYYQVPQFVVFGLGDAQSVMAHMQRLDLRLKNALQLRAWLACTQYTRLDLVHETVAQASNKEAAAELLAVFALVKAPDAARHMLELSVDSKASAAARRWLEQNLAASVPGLIPIAGKGSKLAEAALQFLRDMRKSGHRDFVEECISAAVAQTAARVRQDLAAEREAAVPAFDEATTPAWLRDALPAGKPKKSKAPEWLDPACLPPLLIGKQRLSDDQLLAVISALQSATLQMPFPLLAGLKEHGDPASRDAFAWDLFERWQRAGFPSRDKWAMAAIGFLGGDASALQLTPLVRAWPGESQHQRAVFGLECLRAVGSDTALMQLNTIAQKVKFKGLKARATACMEAIANERGLSRAELEDCIVPDCDLDERGNRTFDYGERTFHFALGKDLKPMVKDEAGKLRADLPKPSGKDDAEKAQAALDAWKLMKKTLREVLKVQAARLEQAMVTGRRWPRERFESLLVRHPLLTHLVRRLVWGVYSGSDELTASFRVTEEREYADVKDRPFDLGQAERIGIVHPAHLSPADAAAWGELFSEYEILPPFPQLGRPIYKLEPGEAEQTELTRFGGFQIEPIVLVGILDRQGWTRGPVLDAGIFHEHHKTFDGAEVIAVIEYDGVPVGYMQDADPQRIKSCYFLRGGESSRSYPKSSGAVKLGSVHAVVLSEVLRDLKALEGKAK